jgi:hypothetical protein
MRIKKIKQPLGTLLETVRPKETENEKKINWNLIKARVFVFVKA